MLADTSTLKVKLGFVGEEIVEDQGVIKERGFESWRAEFKTWLSKQLWTQTHRVPRVIFILGSRDWTWNFIKTDHVFYHRARPQPAIILKLLTSGRGTGCSLQASKFPLGTADCLIPGTVKLQTGGRWKPTVHGAGIMTVSLDIRCLLVWLPSESLWDVGQLRMGRIRFFPIQSYLCLEILSCKPKS